MMTLAEFRRQTAHLAGERELLSAGESVAVLWYSDDDKVSIDGGDPDLDTDTDVVLFRDA